MRSAECRKYWSDIVDVAEGKPRPEAEAHAGSCRECGKRLADLKEIVSLAHIQVWDAPSESLSQARSIFVPKMPVVTATLKAVGSGARTVAAGPGQFRREVDGLSVRIMIRREGSLWHVMGSIDGSSSPLSASVGAQVIELAGTSFEFETESLDEELWLEFADRVVRVPLKDED